MALRTAVASLLLALMFTGACELDTGDGDGWDDDGADDGADGDGDDGGEGYFGADSPFSHRIPDNAEVDPNSDTMIQSLVGSAQHSFVIGLKEFGVPVYFADASTPKQNVPLTAYFAPRSLLEGVPVPANAVPDPGSDGFMVVVDTAAGCEYDFWQARRVGDQLYASWANSIRIDGTGVFPRGAGVRGAGFALLGGLIFPEELAAGRIDHALVFAYDTPKAGGPVPPATDSDGVSTDPSAIPEGALVQLDSSFDVSAITDEYQRTIARCLQEYGMYLCDGGGGVQVYAVNPICYEGNPYDGILPDETWPPLDQIPVDRFRVLKLGAQDPDPDLEVVDSGCGRHQGAWLSGAWSLAAHGDHVLAAKGYEGLSIIDVSVPASPEVVGTYESEGPLVWVEVSGQYAYAADAEGVVLVVDLTDPVDPTLAGTYTPPGEPNGVHVSGQYLYVTYTGDENGLAIASLADPTSPDEVSSLTLETSGDPYGVKVAGDYIYVCDQHAGVDVVDISDVSRPSLVVSFETEGLSRQIHLGDGVAYLADGIGGLRVLDISTPGDPQILATVDPGDFGEALRVSGGYVYLAAGGAGLQILSLSDATHPTPVGSYDGLGAYARDVEVVGSSAFLALGSGEVAVFEVSDPSSPSLLARL